MRLFLTFILLSFHSIGISHPSWGIVVNNQGEVFFTDILHNNGTLWKISKEGELYKIIEGFHAHDLCLDKNVNLWLAENRWIEGQTEDRHYLIKIRPGSKTDTLIATNDKEAFNGSTIAIGPDQSIYFINKKKVYRYAENGAQLYIDHRFSQPKTLMVDANGVMWITDSGINNGTLYRYTPTQGLKPFAIELMPEDPLSPLFDKKNLQYLIGIAKDGQGNVYVSENAGCRIIKINPKGEKSIFYESTSLWSPMNVAFYKGDAYIMEVGYNKGNKGPRIIKKSKSGAITRLVNIETAPSDHIQSQEDEESFSIPGWVYFGLGLITFALVIIISVKRQYSQERE